MIYFPIQFRPDPSGEQFEPYDGYMECTDARIYVRYTDIDGVTQDEFNSPKCYVVTTADHPVETPAWGTPTAAATEPEA